MPTGKSNVISSSFIRKELQQKKSFICFKNFFGNYMLREWQRFSLLGIIHIHLIQIIHLVSLIHFIQFIHHRMSIHILRSLIRSNNFSHNRRPNRCSQTIIIVIIITHRGTQSQASMQQSHNMDRPTFVAYHTPPHPPPSLRSFTIQSCQT